VFTERKVMPTTVVNIKTGAQYTKYIGRGSPYGNDWSHLPASAAKYRVGTRAEAIACFEANLRRKSTEKLKAFLKPLVGEVLGCFCDPLPCHGHVYIKLIKELGLE
jgi:hypothetical protein